MQIRKVPYFNFSKFSGSKLHISSTCAPLQPERRNDTGFFNNPIKKGTQPVKTDTRKKFSNIYNLYVQVTEKSIYQL